MLTLVAASSVSLAAQPPKMKATQAGYFVLRGSVFAIGVEQEPIQT
jgi:hypothetical protein